MKNSRRLTRTMKERFFEKVRKSENCWIWTAALDHKGYGQFSGFDSVAMKHTMMRAHRVSWVFHNGEIKNGLFVLHKCDVPSCVNPDHLFLGTNQDNIDDAVRKQRRFAKIKISDTKTIRHLYFAERRKPVEIAEFFGVATDRIYCVLGNRVKAFTEKNVDQEGRRV